MDFSARLAGSFVDLRINGRHVFMVADPMLLACSISHRIPDSFDRNDLVFILPAEFLTLFHVRR